MKNKVKFFLFIGAGTMALLYSCSGSMNPAKLFSKKWQFESLKSKAYDDQMALAQKMMDTTKDSNVKAQIKQRMDMGNAQMEAMKSMALTCNGDGTCETSVTMMGQSMVTKGKWVLIADGKKVVITDDKSPKADTLNIDELTADKMTVSKSDGQGGTASMTYKSVQ
jgi:hypothetical protein